MATTPADRLDGLTPAGRGATTAETHADDFASKLSREADIVIGVYLILIGTGAILGNGRVLWLSYRCRARLRPVEMFVVSLAVADVGLSLVGHPFSAASSLMGRWSFGSAGCTWYGFVVFFLGIASIATMALMSSMRFMIVYKRYPGQYPSRRASCVLVTAAWLYGLFWACAPLIGWSQYHPEPYGLSCSVDWGVFSRGAGGSSFIICMLLFCTAVPVVIMVTSYAAIFALYRQAQKGVVLNLQVNAPFGGKRQRTERKLTLIALAVCGGFLLAWLPYAVVGLWASVAGVDAVPLGLTSAAPLFAKSNSLWNPTIYLGMNERFRSNMCACLPQTPVTRTAVRMRAQQPEVTLRLSPRDPLVSGQPSVYVPGSSAVISLPGSTAVISLPEATL